MDFLVFVQVCLLNIDLNVCMKDVVFVGRGLCRYVSVFGEGEVQFFSHCS